MHGILPFVLLLIKSRREATNRRKRAEQWSQPLVLQAEFSMLYRPSRPSKSVSQLQRPSCHQVRCSTDLGFLVGAGSEEVGEGGLRRWALCSSWCIFHEATTCCADLVRFGRRRYRVILREGLNAAGSGRHDGFSLLSRPALSLSLSSPLSSTFFHFPLRSPLQEMLKSLVITSGSGLVLFEKEWTKDFELVHPDQVLLRRNRCSCSTPLHVL